MKLLQLLSGMFFSLILLFCTSSQFSSCTKKTIVHDTTTVIKKDTVTIKDTLVVTDTVGCYNLNDGLIAYFNFNGGNLNDSSGYNNNIVFNNATPTTDRFGRANNAYLFNGTSSYMRVSNSASLSPDSISIMAIVKFNDFYRGACSGNSIVMKGPRDEATGDYVLRVYQLGNACAGSVDTSKEVFAGFYGDYGLASGVIDSSDFIKPGVWETVVYTYDGTTSKIYLNGQLKGSYTGHATFTANTNDIYIGATENPSAPYWLNGVIDEIRIYKKALCATAVQQLSTVKE